MARMTFALLTALTILTTSASAKIECRSVYDALGSGGKAFDSARKERSLGLKDSANAILDRLTTLLQEGEVTKCEKRVGSSSGVNVSYTVTFSNGLKGIFKPELKDRPNQPTRESVAYQFSRLLGLDLVPPTVIRDLKGDAVPKDITGVTGSLQLFIETARPLEKGGDRKTILKDGREFKVTDHQSGRRLRVFDWLINNHDRGSNAGNYMVSETDGEIFGIDHGVAWVGHDKTAREDKVPYYKSKYLKDREFYDRLRSASRQDITKVLEGLNPVRVAEFFERYDKLMADFQKVLRSEEAK